MVRNLDPLAFILRPYMVSTYLRHFPLAHDIGAGVAFIVQDMHHRCRGPYPTAPGNIVAVEAVGRFVLRRGKGIQLCQKRIRGIAAILIVIF